LRGAGLLFSHRFSDLVRHLGCRLSCFNHFSRRIGLLTVSLGNFLGPFSHLHGGLGNLGRTLGLLGGAERDFTRSGAGRVDRCGLR